MLTANEPDGTRHYRVAIIGAGFSGIGMAIALKRSGEHDFVVLEKEARVGGTWQQNQYPGCACDVPSHLYSFSFAPKANWSRIFAPQAEIREYIEQCARNFDVLEHVHFGVAVRSVHWDAAANSWRIQTASGTTWTASFLVLGMGGLSLPSYPEIPGLETFQGKQFHSQKWDHSYALTGKRVAVIGTGASAIQFVPQIQKQVAQLDLYQRTPPWILPKPDRALQPLEQSMRQHVPGLTAMTRALTYARLEARALLFVKAQATMKWVQKLATRHIEEQIADPALRRKVTPDYTMGCKRVLLSDDYYPAIAAPNVHVSNDAIREVDGDAIVTSDGARRPVDAIILGTGFRATAPVPAKSVFGVEGLDLVDAWPLGPEAYKGTTVSRFPNLFFLMGPNTGLGHNSMIYMIESQIAYVMAALAHVKQHALACIDVKRSSQAAYNDALQKKAERAIWSTGGCRSWYLHPQSGRNVTLWPDFTWVFRRQTRQFDPEAYTSQAA
jgi:cation diffusion facilitator CzcD-associated flavoprotein CzcO